MTVTVTQESTDTNAQSCPMCESPLVSITINVRGGARTLCSCAKCDKRWWNVNGRLTTLSSVIGDLGSPEAPRIRVRR